MTMRSSHPARPDEHSIDGLLAGLTAEARQERRRMAACREQAERAKDADRRQREEAQRDRYRRQVDAEAARFEELMHSSCGPEAIDDDGDVPAPVLPPARVSRRPWWDLPAAIALLGVALGGLTIYFVLRTPPKPPRAHAQRVSSRAELPLAELLESKPKPSPAVTVEPEPVVTPPATEAEVPTTPTTEAADKVAEPPAREPRKPRVRPKKNPRGPLFDSSVFTVGASKKDKKCKKGRKGKKCRQGKRGSKK